MPRPAAETLTPVIYRMHGTGANADDVIIQVSGTATFAHALALFATVRRTPGVTHANMTIDMPLPEETRREPPKRIRPARVRDSGPLTGGLSGPPPEPPDAA